MGFSFELLLLYPEQRVLPNDDPRQGRLPNIPPIPQLLCTAWRGHETISLGRITRFEKLTEKRFSHLNFSPRERAGICVFSCFLRKIVPRLSHPKLSDFAAPFHIYTNPAEDWDAPKVAAKLGVAELIDVGIRGEYAELFGRQPYPEQEAMEAHNSMLRKKPEEFKRFIDEQYCIQTDQPFFWELCSTLAKWLQEADDMQSEEWREISKEPESLAFVRAWRGYLREVGTIRARALFLFPRGF